jgi:plastocyanin
MTKQPELRRSDMSRLISVSLLTIAAALVVAASAQAQTTRLVGTVGPGFTITLKTTAGKKVTTLKRGAYAIAVTDRSTIHNFHLRGPGVNRMTSVAGTGKTTLRVTLKRGTYRYNCDPHSSTMRGSFAVR